MKQLNYRIISTTPQIYQNTSKINEQKISTRNKQEINYIKGFTMIFQNQ